MRKRPGFTLIELLVVIAVIGILSTLAIVALSSARQKARDSKRVADLNQIGKALELYYTTNNGYPTLITAGQPIADGSTTYLAAVPTNPVPKTDGNCPNQDYQYYYITATNTYVVSSCLGGGTGSFSSGPVGYHSGQGVLNCGGALVDADGNTYRTIQIGTQCWMAENLRTGTKITGHPSNNGVIEKACYADADANCLTDGALYEWSEAMAYSTTAGAQGICPTGWHIPTYQEINVISTLFTDAGSTCVAGRGSYDCQGANHKMKIAGQCNGNTPCATTGFDMPMSGERGTDGVTFGGGPNSSGTIGTIWTSNVAGASSAYYDSFLKTQARIFESSNNRAMSYSIRCVKG